VGKESREVIADLRLGPVGEIEASQPLLHINGLHLIERHVFPLRKDLNLEVVQVALDRCGRAVDIRITQLMQLKVPPRIRDGGLPYPLLLSVDLGAEVLYLTLDIGLLRKVLNVSNGPFSLETCSVLL
jgi:hypothetical protein